MESPEEKLIICIVNLSRTEKTFGNQSVVGQLVCSFLSLINEVYINIKNLPDFRYIPLDDHTIFYEQVDSVVAQANICVLGYLRRREALSALIAEQERLGLPCSGEAFCKRVHDIYHG